MTLLPPMPPLTTTSRASLDLGPTKAAETLYFSGDMTALAAATRLATETTGLSAKEVEAVLARGGALRENVFEALAGSKTTFSFGSPVSWQQVGDELDSFVEHHGKFPEVIVFDSGAQASLSTREWSRTA